MLASSSSPGPISRASLPLQWIHPQSLPMEAASESPKKRRILQPQSHRTHHNHYHSPHHQQQRHSYLQQQLIRSHFIAVPETQATTKSLPPKLMVPFLHPRRDAGNSHTAFESVVNEESRLRTAQHLPPGASPSPATSVPSNAKLLLRPCHVCHRKPSTKVMLDAYADCDLCGQRSCYICLRECNASGCRSRQIQVFPQNDLRTPLTEEEGGCFDAQMRFCNDYAGKTARQKKVCSLCAVEGLTETGEETVWCVDCVRQAEMN